MNGLESWLKQATRKLSAASVARVRSEIREHYESALEAAMSGGATAEEADRLAVSALGDAKAANRQYRDVLLTSAEARLLREGTWEARAICSRSWPKWLLPALPAAMLFAAATSFRLGAIALAWPLFAGGILMTLVFAAPFLPLYSGTRARVPLCEMGCAARHARAGLRAERAQMVLAPVLVPMANGLGRMGAVFDSQETAGRGVA